MFEPPTLKDIATALGLSTSTVSRALRDTYEISSKTKKLVLEYAEKINYQPNPSALSLKVRRSKSIGVLVSEVANYYFSQAINGIESIAYNRGYHVIITQTHESYEREKANIQHLASRSVDGLLVSLSAETVDTEHLSQLHDKGLPMVFFDRIPEAITTHKISADNRQGAYEATVHLIRTGKKKIAHLTSSGNLLITNERLKGYTDALIEYGLQPNPDYLKHCNHGGMFYAEVETAIVELMNLKDRPDAIFVGSDRLSVGCLQALKNLNLPQDITIAGFSNADVLDLFDHPITSVRQPAFEIGQQATEMLLQLIESKHPVTEFENRVLDTKLFIRD